MRKQNQTANTTEEEQPVVKVDTMDDGQRTRSIIGLNDPECPEHRKELGNQAAKEMGTNGSPGELPFGPVKIKGRKTTKPKLSPVWPNLEKGPK